MLKLVGSICVLMLFHDLVNVNNPMASKSRNRAHRPAVANEAMRAPFWTNVRKMRARLRAEPVGNTVLFRCTAGGSQPLTVQWFKNGVEIRRNSRVGMYKLRRRNQLMILESVVTSDRGEFKCVVTNSHGSINHTYELDVAERTAHRPILQFGLPANKTAKVGNDVEFHCRVLGGLNNHMQWLKMIETDGSEVDQKTHELIALKKGSVDKQQVNTLTLRNISANDEGEYICLAGNSIGISHSSAWLTVQPRDDVALSEPSLLQKAIKRALLFVGNIFGVEFS